MKILKRNKKNKNKLCRICRSEAIRKVRYPKAVNFEWLYDCGCVGLAMNIEVEIIMLKKDG
jgi:hypothetical protein